MSRLTLVVAATQSNGIGKGGTLPWRLPKEMSNFAKVTTNAPEGTTNAIIMGRKTWESIPRKFRPLPNRTSLVISRNKDYQLTPVVDTAPAYLHTSLESALERVSHEHFTEGLFTERPIHRLFVIGGASLFCDSIALPMSAKPGAPGFVDRVLLTRVLSPKFEDCDVFMPDFLKESADKDGEEAKWTRASSEDMDKWVDFEVAKGIQEENEVQYEFQMWVR